MTTEEEKAAEAQRVAMEGQQRVPLPEPQELPNLVARMEVMFQTQTRTLDTLATNQSVLTLLQQQVANQQERLAQDRHRVPRGVQCPVWGADIVRDQSWLGHLQSFRSYGRMTGITDEMAKELLVSSIKGEKSNQCLGLGPGFPGWEQMTYGELQTELTNIFRPASEASLAKTNYKARKQSVQESVQVYASAKKSLYLQAYPTVDANRSVDLIEDFIAGIANYEVIRQVMNKGVFATYAEAASAAMHAVGVERELVHLGHRKDTTGLESQTAGSQSRAERAIQTGMPPEQPMDINAIEEEEEEEEEGEILDSFDIQQYEDCLNALSVQGQFQGNCFRCQKFGHSARNCTSNARGGTSNLYRRGGASRKRGGTTSGMRSGRGRSAYRRGGLSRGSSSGTGRDHRGRFVPGNRGTAGALPVYELSEGADPTQEDGVTQQEEGDFCEGETE